jgi:hypothetical protein
MGLVLTLYQIAVQEGFVGAIKSSLRAFLTTTGQPADDDEANEK